MIAACKPESKNEEAHDKVRPRSAMTTKPVEGIKELENQIARLMAALARAEQGNCPASAPNSPRQRGYGKGWMDRSTPGHPISHNGQTSLAQPASAHSTSVSCSTATTTSRSQGQNSQGSKEGTINRKDSSSLQYFRCQGWGHMAQECTTPAKTLYPSRGTKGMQPNPLPAPVGPSIPSLTPK